jgi:methionyl-tRNA formyltransferase
MADLVLVTGHVFGQRAYEGIFASDAYLDGRLRVALMIGLDDSRAAATVGYQPLSALAGFEGVPYVGIADGRLRSVADRIKALAPAYLLVIGWSYLIPPDVLAIPSGGCIGMHPTRLPLGRGQAPIPWSIIKGVETTALSVFFLEPAADTGPVIAQYELAIRPRETSASLFYRLGQAHFTAGLELAGLLASGVVPAVVQDEALATRWPRRRPSDGEIKPTMTAAEIDRLVRAQLGPYPRAFLLLDGRRVAVRGVALSSPGSGSAVRFRCADGSVWLLRDDIA